MRRAFPTKAGLEWRPVSTQFAAAHLIVFNAHKSEKTECWIYSCATGRYYLSLQASAAYQLADTYLSTGPAMQSEPAATSQVG